MKQVSINELFPEQTGFCFRSVMKYTPTVLQNTIIRRKASSFFYVMQGGYRYQWDQGELLINSGDLVYLPQGASYRYTVLSRDTLCIQLELDILDRETRQKVIFSQEPDSAAGVYEAQDILEKIFNASLQQDMRLRLNGYFFLLLDCYREGLFKRSVSRDYLRIAPAADYIRFHLNEKIPVPYLAKLCYLSEAQFRRLFKKEMGMPPAAFRNSLVIQTAKNRLRSGYGTMGELAEALGFSTLYAFSQTFKRHTGLSPSAYARRHPE